MMKIIKDNIVLIGLSLLSLVLIGWLITHNKKINHAPTLVPQVNVTSVVQKDMPLILELAGNTLAYQTVQVKSLVSGQLININFREGQNIKTNDLLFKIDSREFEYQLQASEAALLRDQAQLENAEKEEQRYRDLFAKKAVSQEQYLQMLTNMNVLKATIAADKAMIKTAQLQIEYAKILSPINGKAGESNFDIGNLIQANSTTPMVSINTISPIYVSFSVPEQYLNALRNAEDANNLPVIIKTSSGEEIKDGKIVFIDNMIDTTTGTIKLKALFPNVEEVLWPGQFVKIYLNVRSKKDALIVPKKAVQINQEGSYVFVIKEDNKAEIRKIKIDFSNDNYSVVSEGIQKGDKIVVDGQLRLTHGTEVIPKVIQEGS